MASHDGLGAAKASGTLADDGERLGQDCLQLASKLGGVPDCGEACLPCRGLGAQGVVGESFELGGMLADDLHHLA